MSDYVAFEAPAWLWLFACAALLAAGVALGALAAYALRIARALDRIDDYEELAAPRADVETAFAAVHARLAKLEAPEPIPVRLEPPATIRNSAPPSIELPANGETSPGFAWHTRIAS